MFINAIAKNKLNDALPNTSIARSNISNLNTLVNTLRKITPKPNAHTNCGKPKSENCAAIIEEKAKHAAKRAIVSIVELAVIKRI